GHRIDLLLLMVLPTVVLQKVLKKTARRQLVKPPPPGLDQDAHLLNRFQQNHILLRSSSSDGASGGVSHILGRNAGMLPPPRCQAPFAKAHPRGRLRLPQTILVSRDGRGRDLAEV